MALTNKLSAIGDAIREKTGKADKLSLDQMVTEIAGIETGGGGTDLSIGLLDGTMTEYKNAELTTALRYYAFYQHTGLKRVILPNYKHFVPSNCFRYCTSLELFDAPCATIQASAMGNSGKLNTLVLRRTDAVVNLLNVSAFVSTPFASGGTGGTAYVPSALVESYKTATNWSTLYAAGTCNFVAIEGSEYE